MLTGFTCYLFNFPPLTPVLATFFDDTLNISYPCCNFVLSLLLPLVSFIALAVFEPGTKGRAVAPISHAKFPTLPHTS